MLISNAFHTYEVVFVFLINYLKISTAWGRGKYFSEYEYPEIQLLFSAKEETNGEGGSKTGIIRSAQDNVGFSSVLDSDTNSLLETSERKKLSKEEMLKPWMRKPYAEEIKNEKTSDDDEKTSNEDEKVRNLQESQATKNNLFKEIPPERIEKTKLWRNDDKHEKRFSDNIKSLKESDNGSANELLPRKIKYHKRLKIQNHNRISPFRADANKRFKSTALKAWNGNDVDLPEHQERDSANESEQGKNTALNNINEKIYSGSRVLPEYEENVQEYDELTGMLNKNVAMAVNNQPSTLLPISQTKEEMMSSGVQPYEGLSMESQKIKVTNVGGIVTNVPTKQDFLQEKVTNADQGIVSNPMTLFNKIPSLVTENNKVVIRGSPSNVTNPSLSSIQENNSKLNILKSNLKPNGSQANEELHKGNGMMLRQSNRAVQENHPLLAKPPVKIAGTLMDKHSEDDSEVVLEEKGTKIVKLPQINSILQTPSTMASIGHSVVIQNNAVNTQNYAQNEAANNVRESETANTFLFQYSYDPPSKKKRNINQKNIVKTHEELGEKSSFLTLSKYNADNKTLENKSNSGLTDASIDLDTDEISESRRSKFIKPEYYSLSKSNSALGMVNNLITRLRPAPFVKKKKIRGDKYNDSYKRNAPFTYDKDFDASYDYFRSKEGKKGDPIRAYYDYENDYDFDYDKENDYPRVTHSNHSALAAEKELFEYDGRGYLNNFPRGKNKSRRKKYRKVEETYRDIFAHPISLDDPELQIVRDDDDELVKRRMHNKNIVARHHREKMQGREFRQFLKDKASELESLPRSHLKRKKMEPPLHARHNKVPNLKKQALGESDGGDKKVH